MKKLNFKTPEKETVINNASTELASNKPMVDAMEVGAMANILKGQCRSMECRFAIDKENSALVVKVSVETNTKSGKKYTRTFESYADSLLIEAIIDTMVNKENCDSLFLTYLENSHEAEVQKNDENLIHELFVQLLDSPYKMVQEKSFRPSQNDVYYCFSFYLSYNRSLKFCIKQDAEIDKMLSTLDEESV